MGSPQTLLASAVDYAGLFPPAALTLEAAARSYAGYLAGSDAWALGRFVVPVARLGELAEMISVGGHPWPLAVVAGADPAADADLLVAGQALLGTRAAVEAVEFRAASAEQVLRGLAAFPDSLLRFVEVPLGPALRPVLEAVKAGGGAAKFRTGGMSAEAFPDPDDLLDALEAVTELDLPFKCTAGLHHPVRGRYPLSYAPAAPTGTMYGYLNVLMAALAFRVGWGRGTAREILLETDSAAFDPGAGAWRGRTVPAEVVEGFRRDGFLGFGSCSFREPVDALAPLGTA